MNENPTHMGQGTPRIISRERLRNGTDLIVEDLSRRIAGDRWHVRLRAEVHISRESCVAALRSRAANIVAGPEEAAEWVSEGVTVAFHKERHFVADQAVADTLQACGKELLETVLPYVCGPAFIAGAVARHCAKHAERERLAALCADAQHDTPEAADREPADFSACFRA